jgi:hypothetical protein
MSFSLRKKKVDRGPSRSTEKRHVSSERENILFFSPKPSIELDRGPSQSTGKRHTPFERENILFFSPEPSIEDEMEEDQNR